MVKKAKLHLAGIDKESECLHLAFHCPGCGHAHVVRVNCKIDRGRAFWEWNKSYETPTFSPSILSKNQNERCHCYVTDGNIRFLSDCSHALAGATVEIPEWE